MKYFLSIVILTFSLSLWSHEGGHHEKEQTCKIGDQNIERRIQAKVNFAVITVSLTPSCKLVGW